MTEGRMEPNPEGFNQRRISKGREGPGVGITG